jgi:hypothetical protein
MQRVRVATLEGSLTDLGSLAIRLFEGLHLGVHAELWIEDGSKGVRVAAMCTEKSSGASGVGSILIRQDALPPPPPDGSQWHTVDVPVRDMKRVWNFILEVVDAGVPYGINVLECTMPKSILDRIDPDVDCSHPDTWGQVYCSQFVLLFLRWCDAHGVLGVPESRSRLLWSVNSRECVPSMLREIADAVFNH